MRFLFSIKTNENEMKKMYLQICQYIVNIYYIIIDKKKTLKELIILMYESSSASVEEATRTPAWVFQRNLRKPQDTMCQR